MTDDAFLAAFEAARLPSFDHRDYLRVAFAYARRGGVDHAVARARRGLRHFAAAHDDPDRYHETRAALTAAKRLTARRPPGVSRRPWPAG
jgi:hypothetical protein